MAKVNIDRIKKNEIQKNRDHTFVSVSGLLI